MRRGNRGPRKNVVLGRTEGRRPYAAPNLEQGAPLAWRISSPHSLGLVVGVAGELTRALRPTRAAFPVAPRRQAPLNLDAFRAFAEESAIRSLPGHACN